MIKDKITSKMFEMEIKDFSETELRRVFQDCVAQNNLFACARELIGLGMLTMKDVYFLPCLGNDESMLDEELSGHKYHCPKCNTHLTSLYFCCDCGVRYDWVAAFGETMSLEKEVAELIANEVGWFNGWKASEEMFDKSCRKAARKVIKRLTQLAPDKAKAAALPNSVAVYRVSKKKSLANPPCG